MTTRARHLTVMLTVAICLVPFLARVADRVLQCRARDPDGLRSDTQAAVLQAFERE